MTKCKCYVLLHDIKFLSKYPTPDLAVASKWVNETREVAGNITHLLKKDVRLSIERGCGVVW